MHFTSTKKECIPVENLSISNFPLVFAVWRALLGYPCALRQEMYVTSRSATNDGTTIIFETSLASPEQCCQNEMHKYVTKGG